MKDQKLKCFYCPNVFSFTVGKEYEFSYSPDPEGWEVQDDNGNTEIFFDTTKMFEL